MEDWINILLASDNGMQTIQNDYFPPTTEDFTYYAASTFVSSENQLNDELNPIAESNEVTTTNIPQTLYPMNQVSPLYPMNQVLVQPEDILPQQYLEQPTYCTMFTQNACSTVGANLEEHNAIDEQKVSNNVQIDPNVVEAFAADGYNWRNYEQQQVRGNEDLHSRYNIIDFNHPNTLAGQSLLHGSSSSVPNNMLLENVKLAYGNMNPSLHKQNGSQLNYVTPGSVQLDCDVEGDEPASTRRKNETRIASRRVPIKPAKEYRVILHTISVEDIIKDGYRWRKYGQKDVKGKPNPRNYYICSNDNCSVKKHIERDANDIVVTTYIGRHNHAIDS